MIKIRKFKEGDEKGIRRFMNKALKERKFPYIAMTEVDKKTAKKWKKSNLAKETICIVAETDGKIIGSGTIHKETKGRVKHRAVCGWSVAPEYWNKKVGSKLLQILVQEAKKAKLKRLEAEIVIKNKASLALAKKFGFKVEGKRRRAHISDKGGYEDSYLLGKLL